VDQRDEGTWIAVELSKQGELKVEDRTLEASLRTDLEVDGAFEIFIPATTYVRDGRSVTIHLIEGYVFLRSGLPEVRYFGLENFPYVNQVMSTKSGPHGMRVLSTIPDVQIQTMRTRLREQVVADIPPGTRVEVVEGTYRHLEGEVLFSEHDMATVLITLRSLELIVNIPLVFLEAIEAPKESEEPSAEAEDVPQEQAPQPGKRLTARDFYEEIVLVLGRLTKYQAGAFVHMEEVMPLVLRQKGMDPKNLPDGWELRGVGGIYRRVGYAFRNQRQEYCTNPKTLQGVRRGMWGLTEEGVALALRLKAGER